MRESNNFILAPFRKFAKSAAWQDWQFSSVIPGMRHQITQRGNRRQQTLIGEPDYALAQIGDSGC